MTHMPKIVRPADQPPFVDDYISVFGNRARFAIIKFLRDNGPSIRVEIAEGTELPNPTLGHHLAELERVGAIMGDLSPEMRRGRTVRYKLNRERIRELLAAPESYIFD